MQIADNYLIPKILNDHKMDDIPINFTQSAIKTISISLLLCYLLIIMIISV